MRKAIHSIRLVLRPHLALFLTCILQVVLPIAPQQIISATSGDSRPADNEGVIMISITSSQDGEPEDKTGKEPFIPMIPHPFQSPLFQSPFQSPFQSLFQTPSLLLNNLRSSATVDTTNTKTEERMSNMEKDFRDRLAFLSNKHERDIEDLKVKARMQEKLSQNAREEMKKMATRNLNLKQEVDKLNTKVSVLEKKLGMAPAKLKKGLSTNEITNPASCNDLGALGYNLNGFYTVQGKGDTSGKLESVLCRFNVDNFGAVNETRVGYIDVKSSSGVHFLVQKDKSFDASKALSPIIPFDVEKLNIGGAMNYKTGIFKAPVEGIYDFFFSGIRNGSPTPLRLNLRVNGINVGLAYATIGNNNANTTTWAKMVMQSKLSLNAGDQVDLHVKEGILYDDEHHHTQFSGSLVEQTSVMPK